MTGGLQGAHALQPVTTQAPRLVPTGNPTAATALTQPCKGQRIRSAPCHPVRRLLMRTPACRPQFQNVNLAEFPVILNLDMGLSEDMGGFWQVSAPSPS